MRRLLLIISIFAFVGCQKSDVDEVNSGETVSPYDESVISLTVGVDLVETKGYKVETPAAMATVGLFAAHHTGGAEWSSDGSGDVDFDNMQDECLAYSDGAWLYVGDPVKWGWESLSDKYTFFGYSPYGTVENNITPSIDEYGRLTIDYKVNEECTKQSDLTVASLTNIYMPSTGSVTLDFDHALTMVSFQLVNYQSFPDPNKRIKRVTIESVSSEGTLTYDGDGSMSWEASEPASFTAQGNLHVEPKNSAQNVTTDGNYLMMVPQKFDDAVKVTVVLSHELGGCEEEKSFYIPAGTVWEAGEHIAYVVEDDSYIITDRDGASNCYMIHPDEYQVYYIPLDGRINEFWCDYAGEYPFYISDAIGLKAEIIWHDSSYESEVAGVTYEFIDFMSEGFDELRQPNGITVANHPCYINQDVQVAMKVTVPRGMNECNISVAVWKDMDGDNERDTEYSYDDEGYLTSINEMLWSWHLWVTDYNPDTYTGSVSTTTYEYPVTGGEIHKYNDRENGLLDGATAIWGDILTTGGTAIYQDKCIMDRHIGAWSSTYDGMGGIRDGKGYVAYQFGRKDPFPGYSGSANYTSDFSFGHDATGGQRFSTAVHNPNVFYGGGSDVNWCDPDEIAGYSLCLLWNDKKVNNPNIPSLDHAGNTIDLTGHLTVTDGGYDNLRYEKSIFDPSPIGWRLPIAGVYSNFTVTSGSDTDIYPLNPGASTAEDTSSGVLYRYYVANGAIFPMSGFMERSGDNSSQGEYGFSRTASPSIQNADYDEYDWTSSNPQFTLKNTDFGYILCSGNWTVTNDYSYLRAHGMPARAIQE